MRLMHKPLLATAVIALAAVMCVSAQDTRPRFEVASIKASRPGRTADNGGLGLRFGSGRFDATNASVKDLIAQAYRLPSWRIVGGPEWIEPDMMVTTNRYNVQATAADTSDDQLRIMLQTLLADCFGLKVHREDKPGQTVYELVVGKNGHKLQELAVEVYKATWGGGGGRLFAEQMTMPDLARHLADQLETPVSDKTGLKGVYKFQVTWTPEVFRTGLRAAEPQTVKGEPAIDANGISIFTALQEQLGLKLESARGPVEVLVIDSVSRPSEN